MDYVQSHFYDRVEAGRLLARELRKYAGRSDVVVLALPRGGVPVGFQVASELKAPLDIFVVRKLGVPGHEELGMGAIATGGVRILHDALIRELGLSKQTIDLVSAQEWRELERREKLYRGDRPAQVLENRTVIIVDDGLATGSTMKAAVQAVRQLNPARLIVAVPTAPAETCEEICQIADEAVCALTPEPFFAVGGSYQDFTPTTDDEVRDLIERAAKREPDRATPK